MGVLDSAAAMATVSDIAAAMAAVSATAEVATAEVAMATAMATVSAMAKVAMAATVLDSAAAMDVAMAAMAATVLDVVLEDLDTVLEESVDTVSAVATAAKAGEHISSDELFELQVCYSSPNVHCFV